MKTKDKILSTTLDLYNKKGVYNVSSRLISSTMGISPGNFSYHYPSMSRLVTELFGQYLESVSTIDDNINSFTDYVYERYQLMKIQFNYRFLFLNLFDITQKYAGIKDLLLLKAEEDNQKELERLIFLQNNGYIKTETEEETLLKVSKANNRSFRTWLVDAMLHADSEDLDIRYSLTHCISNAFHYLTPKGIEELSHAGIDL